MKTLKTFLLVVVVSAAFFTSCKKEDFPEPSKASSTYQIRIESVGTNDSITYSPIIVIR